MVFLKKIKLGFLWQHIEIYLLLLIVFILKIFGFRPQIIWSISLYARF